MADQYNYNKRHQNQWAHLNQLRLECPQGAFWEKMSHTVTTAEGTHVMRAFYKSVNMV